MLRHAVCAVLLAPALALAQASSSGADLQVDTATEPEAATTSAPACPPGTIANTIVTAETGQGGGSGTGGTGTAGTAGTGDTDGSGSGDTDRAASPSVICIPLGAAPVPGTRSAPPVGATPPAGGHVPGSGSGNAGLVGGAASSVPPPRP
jgi:hypothetical protein